MEIKGRLFALTGKDGHLIRDIDTDQIFHNRYLYIIDPAEMARYIFDNLEGYENYAKIALKNDIIIAGHNFGAGSSRQQAVEGFKALGIGAIIAPSFGAIYKRNAINSALPIVQCPDVESYLKNACIKHGEDVTLLFEEGKIKSASGKILACLKPSKVQIDIFKAGNLFEYGKIIA